MSADKTKAPSLGDLPRIPTADAAPSSVPTDYREWLRNSGPVPRGMPIPEFAWRSAVAAMSEAFAGMCAEVERLSKELEAYKRAKSENDERFQLERDEARAEVERVKGQLEVVSAHRDSLQGLVDTAQPAVNAWQELFNEACAERNQALEEINLANEQRDSLLAGLKPFAEYGKTLPPGSRADYPLNDAGDRTGRGELPTVGDCRRAAELVAKLEAEARKP